jgi:hypothetical protein
VLHSFLAHVAQLDGVLFAFFGRVLTFVLLLLVRLFLKRESCPASILVLASVGSCQFVFYNFLQKKQNCVIFQLIKIRIEKNPRLYPRGNAAPERSSH